MPSTLATSAAVGPVTALVPPSTPGAPVVATSAATGITTTAATLHGSVNPVGAATTWHFEWGTTTAYGNTTAGGSAGSGSLAIAETEAISGLTPATTYHFRMVGVNGIGTAYGFDRSFTTASPAPPPVPPPPTGGGGGLGPGGGGGPGDGPGTISGCGVPAVRFFQSYFWKFIVTNLNTETITSLDRLASNRQVTKTLGGPLFASLQVPSDNKRVNIPYTDLDPKVGEGTRCLIGFRHEAPGQWTCRASALIFQAHDGLESESPVTTISAWDPWKYLDFLPVINHDVLSPGRVFPAGTSYDQVVITLLTEAVANYNDIFIDFGQTPYYGEDPVPSGTGAPGVIETCPGPTDGNPTISFLNGTSIGDCLRRVMSTGHCRIILDPIYDPAQRPGILAQLSIFNPVAGQPFKPTTIFSWNQMPRSATSLDRLQDGSQRANNIQFYHTRGGPPVSLKTDLGSVAKFRRYFRSRFIVTQGGNVETVESLATADLVLRASGVETLTVDPTPDRSKVAFLDYDIGDFVRVQTNKTFRQPIDDFYKVMEIPITISDEALEEVNSLTVAKQVLTPPPSDGPTTSFRDAVLTGQRISNLSRRSTITSLPGP